MNKKHIRLIKNHVSISVKRKGIISKIGKYNPRRIVKTKEFFLEE
jgi:hypothetical protein